MTEFNAATGEYRITGAGANMWAKEDQFQYVWREMTGNFTVSSSLKFLGTGAGHRKGGIVVRETLDTDGNMPASWSTATACRRCSGAATRERSRTRSISRSMARASSTSSSSGLACRVFLFVGKNGAEPKEVVHTEVSFQGPVMVGLAVTSHDPKAKDTLVFSNVKVEAQPAPAPRPQ